MRYLGLHGGRVVAEGSPAELRGTGTLDDAYLRLVGADLVEGGVR